MKTASLQKNPTLVFAEVESWEEKSLKHRFPKSRNVGFFRETVDQIDFEKLRSTTILSTFIYSKIDEVILRRLPLLKAIATRSTGFDHIDLAACKRRKITVMNVPHYGQNTVAEHTFALILALSRKIFQSYERTEKMRFDHKGLTGFDLFGKTIGVIGAGNIGQHVIRIAHGFSMNVLAYDPQQDPKLAKRLKFVYVPLSTLLKRSDVITTHVPYLPATHHLLNRSNVPLIKKGAILINTARGGIVETEALIRALDEGILSGAGLDVLEEECVISEEREFLSAHFPETCNLKTVLENHVLIARDDVIITPHNAFNSKEALERILGTTVENINGFHRGRPANVVTN